MFCSSEKSVCFLMASLEAQCKRICLQCRRLKFDPWVERYSGGGNGSLLQYSYLGNPMDREAQGATVHGVAKNRT